MLINYATFAIGPRTSLALVWAILINFKRNTWKVIITIPPPIPEMPKF